MGSMAGMVQDEVYEAIQLRVGVGSIEAFDPFALTFHEPFVR